MTIYLNFELEITALPNGTYLVEVVDAPFRLSNPEPSHIFTFPIPPEALNYTLMVLSGQRNPRGQSRMELAKQFGERLFTTIFGEQVLAAFHRAQAIAEKQQKWLRIRLDVKEAGSLAMLPWEFLREPNVDFLALSRSTPIVRYAEQYMKLPRTASKPPLRVLVMISNPDDVPKIDEKAERFNLDRATIHLQEQGLLEIHYLEDASLRNLQRTLRQNEFHVFHFIGHGAFNPETQVGTLILEDPFDHTKAYPIRGEALARELHEEETLRLVVLNSCQGAAYDNADPFSGVATSLVQRGMPAVVAQQFEITDRAAVIFSEEFYRAVAEGLPLEAAVAEGRRAIASTLDNTEWATPVLFLHEMDSRQIFSFPNPNQPSVQRFWQRITLPQAVLVGLLLLLLGLMLASVPFSANDEVIAIPPPTATPIPNVDVVVQNVRLSPRNPQVGDLVAVLIDIQNLGSDPAPPFTYEWQANIFDPSSTVTRRVEGLAPNGILHDNLAIRLGWWGVFIAETRLDTLNELVELSEVNNRTFPIRTDNTLPLVVNFDDPLPNGLAINQNQPMPLDAFLPWGFQVEVALGDDPACAQAVPWFKFVGISQIALGTGLPFDPNQCHNLPLIITFLDSRPDNNPSGVSRAVVTFAGGTGQRVVQAFSDVTGEKPMSRATGTNSRAGGISLEVDNRTQPFTGIFRLQISGEGQPLLITGLTLTAP